MRIQLVSLLCTALFAFMAPAQSAQSNGGQTTNPVPPPQAETLFGATRSFTGAIDNKWSNPSNWSPAGVPQPGDTLVFGEYTTLVREAVNDLPAGRTYAVILGDGDAFTLSGNRIGLTGGAAAESRLDFRLAVDLGSTSQDFQKVAFYSMVTGTGTLTGTASFAGPVVQGLNGTLDGVGSVILGTDLSSATFRNSRVVGNGRLGLLTGSVQIQPSNASASGPGVFQTGPFQAAGGYLFMSFDSTTSSRVEVTGPVNVEGMYFLSMPTYDFDPAVGTVFTMISNDGTDPIVGTIRDFDQADRTYPEGSILSWYGFTLRLSYKGGDGNDLTVTVLSRD